MTPRDVKGLDTIRRSITVLGFAPTVRELADEVGVTVSGAHKIIERLVAEGKVKHTPARTRGLALANEPDLRVVDSDALRAELARRGESLDALSRSAPIPMRGGRPCACDTCGNKVGYGKLFCYTHWCRLPRDLQEGIRLAFATGDTGRYQDLVAEARDVAEGGQRWRRAS